MMTMLEKMAAAAWPFLWEAGDTTTLAHNEARARLRAAIEAIREPSEVMVEAGERQRDGEARVPGFGCHDTGGIWATMIDAILRGEA